MNNMVLLPALGTFYRARSVKVNYSGLSSLFCSKLNIIALENIVLSLNHKKLETVLKFSTHSQNMKRHYKDKILKLWNKAMLYPGAR